MKKRIGLGLALLLAATAAFAAVGGGDVTMKYKGGEAYFSHDKHVTDIGLKCTECHDKLYLSVAQHKKVTMKEMQKGKSCGTCHNGKTAFTVKGNCKNCHKK